MTALERLREQVENVQWAHNSDCALHSAPAYPIGPCNCDGEAPIRLARALCDPGTVEKVARMLDPSPWRVFDGYLADMKRKYSHLNTVYDPDAFKDKASMARAQAILNALAEMAVGE